MRKIVIKLLYKLLDWLESVEPTSLDLRASVLVRQAEALQDVSGEWKRHQVYAQLMKEYPEVSKRDISLVIEQTLQG